MDLPLAISKGVVETHVGVIWAENVTDDVASFVVRLAAEVVKI